MKIHISLVGRETAPVYLGIIEAVPDLVILIHSSDTEKETERIKVELPNLNIQKRKFDPMDLTKIFSDIDKLKQQLSADDTISLNLIGGTKFWSLAFYSAFNGMKNVSINLVDQQNNIWDFKTLTSKQLEFDIERNFRLYGNPLTKYFPFVDFIEEDFEVAKKIESIRKINFDDFTKLTALSKAQENDLRSKEMGEFSLPSGSKIEWFKPDYAIVYLSKKGKIIENELKSPFATNILFNSHWFEVKVARLLTKFYDAKSIYINCKFPAQNNSDKNEVDIVINTGTKPLFVECKTQIKNTTDIDKFNTVVRNYGGKGAKALFVTDAKMTTQAIEKCEESNIAHISLQHYKNENDLKQLLSSFIGKTNK